MKFGESLMQISYLFQLQLHYLLSHRSLNSFVNAREEIKIVWISLVRLFRTSRKICWELGWRQKSMIIEARGYINCQSMTLKRSHARQTKRLRFNVKTLNAFLVFVPTFCLIWIQVSTVKRRETFQRELWWAMMFQKRITQAVFCIIMSLFK